jgi:tetratricopeptide (TPR) repeat protein
VVALPFGRSWGEFLDKIRSEFLGVRMLNVVSFGQGLLLLGVRPHSWLLPILQSAGLLLAACMFLSDRESPRGMTLARRALVLVAATGLFVGSWPNYYAVLPLVLLPHYAREHPRLAAGLAGAFALSFLLPEFDAAVLREQPWLHIVKLVPYWAAPIAMVVLEVRHVAWSARLRRLATPVIAALALAAVLEVARMSISRGHETEAGEFMARRDARSAVQAYRLAGRFTPGDPVLHMSEAIALMAAGEPGAARNRFERAVALDPADPVIRDNFGRMLLMGGLWDEAGAQLEKARQLTPNDPQVLSSLARARWQQGRGDEARALLVRAHELDPGDRAVMALSAAFEMP